MQPALTCRLLLTTILTCLAAPSAHAAAAPAIAPARIQEIAAMLPAAGAGILASSPILPADYSQWPDLQTQGAIVPAGGSSGPSLLWLVPVMAAVGGGLWWIWR